MDIKELIKREIWSLNEESNQFNIEIFDSLNSFAARKRYADENLTRLGSGTARIVYLMNDGKKVLKLAKNKKGLDQNNIECSIGQDHYYKDIVTEVYDCHDDDLWIVSEYAKKITPNRFRELVGFSIGEVYRFLMNFENKQEGKQEIYHLENNDEMWDNRFISKLADLSNSHDILIGDWSRISSYGETIKEGKPTVVLTDYGLSEDVFTTHYQKVRESIDENYFDLDEDLNYEDDLMNYVNPDEIRDGGYAGFALLPNSISQGGLNNANEALNLFDYKNVNINTLKKAISYIKNFNLGKIDDLLTNTELKELYESYMIALQNIEKALQVSKDDLNFFNKILNVQDFLKKHKIIKEDLVYWHVDNASPEKDKFSLITEQGNDETLDRVANFVANKLGYDQPSYIDSGENGVAYDLKNGQVLKITLDKSEAIESLNIKGKQNKHIANIYKVFQIDYPELSYLDIYAIILEKIDTSDQFNIVKMIEELDEIFYDEFSETVSSILALYHTDLQYYNNTYKDVINNILNEISPEKKEFFNQYLQLADEVRKNGIKSADYINERNLGYKNGNLTFFDVGASVKENFGKKRPKKIKMVEDGTSLYTTLQGTVNPGDTSWNLHERIMSWMPKSKAVSVKKKCRIGGGKSGRSYACNQGDINALNITDIDDDNKKRRKDNWVNIAENTIKRKKDDEIFDYTSTIKDLWHDIIKKGKEFYSVNFDTENNDTTSEKKTFYFEKDLRKKQPIKYEINAELWQAGGDWEYPVMYFKIELTNDYGLKRKEHEKKKEFPWDVESAVLDKKFIIIPPVKAGNKYTELDKNKKYKYTAWDEDLLKEKNIDEDDIKITDSDKKKAWKWLEEKLGNAVDQRHEKLDESKKDNTHNLIKENLIFEDIENIQNILSEKNIDIDDFAKKIANKLGYHQVHYLGEGTKGYAFSLTSKILMKITSDRSEAYEAIKLKGKNNDHIGNFYNVYELEEPYNNIFIILREQLDVDVDRVINLENDSKYEYDNYYLEFFEKNKDFLLKDEYKYMSGYQMLINLESGFIGYNYDEIEKIINKIGRNKFPATLQYLGIIKDFFKNNIKSYDFGEENFGFKSNGNLAYYDVGYSQTQDRSTIDKLKVESMKKNNKSLLKEEKIKFGALMLYFDITQWDNIINNIKEKDLYDDGSGTFGREEFPHVTVLYGFHPEVKSEELDELVKDLKPFELRVKGVSLFENKDFDVVKFDIEPNEEILKLREKLATLPHTLTYKDYKPHMTIAYVKSGEGKKYIKNFENPIVLRGNKLVFSNKNKEKKEYHLNE